MSVLRVVYTVTMFAVVAVLVVFGAVSSELIVGISSQRMTALSIVSFCVDCPSPDIEGSFVNAITSKHGLKEYLVTGELVYCVPNFVHLPSILNEHQLVKRIALVDRGGDVSLIEKALRVQRAGALGVIIADDGRCNSQFTFCGPRAGSIAAGGIAANDEYSMWGAITIPVVMVTLESADKLRRLMGTRQVDIPKLGMQNITIFKHTNDDEL